jgi:hypothetical protein
MEFFIANVSIAKSAGMRGRKTERERARESEIERER